MRAFVLCTGRCGSLTLTHACAHITNYTSAHESRIHHIEQRLDYPDHHIEIDNRLAWHLGELHHLYGDDALYIHLRRDPEQVAASYARRFHIKAGIMRAYTHGIIRAAPPTTPQQRLAAARRYVSTVTHNIETFMAPRPNTCLIDIDDPEPGLQRLWGMLWAQGDYDAALAEMTRRYNAS